MPNLLVSVRNVEEAAAAIDAGVQIIDVKEPAHGSLGMADVEVIDSIVAMSRQQQADVRLSAALGEVLDWEGSTAPVLPAGLTYAKLGLAGLRDRRWVAEWSALRRRVDASCHGDLNWIAVSYVDHEPANAPSPEQVIDSALETGCAGVLFDTWAKSSGNLLSHMAEVELAGHIERIRSAGLLAAVAGSLSIAAIVQLRQLPVDVVAVRGAACRSGDRTAAVCPDRIRELRAALAGVAGRRESVLIGEGRG